MDITAQIDWTGVAMADAPYSRSHDWRFDGGATVAASASPDIVPAPGSDPALVDPEEALVASLASCHMMFFLALAAKQGFVVTRYTDSPKGEMRAAPGEPMSIRRIALNPRAEYDGEVPEPNMELALHQLAHKQCFIANSLRAEVLIDCGHRTRKSQLDAVLV